MQRDSFKTPYRRIRANIQPPGMFTRIFAVIAAGGLAVLTFMFSLVIFSIVLAVGLIGGLYLWWKTREVRKQMRAAAEAAAAAAAAGGDGFSTGFDGSRGRAAHTRGDNLIIEGDYIREVPEPDSSDKKH